MQIFYPYLIAGLIGFFVGLEREKAHAGDKALGIRTFLLLSLLGATAGALESPLVQGAIAAFSLSLVGISYYNSRDRGLTTEIAAALVFVLGFSAHKEPMVSAVLGPLVALVLISKSPLHAWTKDLKIAEVQAAILLLLLAITVWNLLPDRTVDPWELFNPKKFGYIVLILGGLEFTSYVLVKIWGPRFGHLATGFLGGFVSSTAVTLSLARSSKKRSSPADVGVALAALTASLLELVLLVAFISWSLMVDLLPSFVTAIVIGSLLVWKWRKKDHSHQVELRSPLDLKGVIRLSVFFMAVLMVVALAKEHLGSAGILTASLITGTMELHGLTMATATMHKYGRINTDLAHTSLIGAAIASFITKAAIARFVGSSAFAGRYALGVTLIGLGMVAAAWI